MGASQFYYRQSERVFTFTIEGQVFYPHKTSISLKQPDIKGPLGFAVECESESAAFELELFGKDDEADYRIRSVDGAKAIITFGGRELPLTEFFEEHAPTFWFADGSSLEGAEYANVLRQPGAFPRERIEIWDWVGTSIRVESQGVDRLRDSVQFRVIQEIAKRNPVVLFDDDDHGESADVVAVFERENHVEIELWHCKYAHGDQPGHRIKDLYEVCGQAQKCIHWIEKPRDFFNHLLRREPRKFKGQSETRFERGTKKDLLRVQKRAEFQRVLFKVMIVQPGLSRSEASQEQLELLAVTENYLMDTFVVPLQVIASP